MKGEELSGMERTGYAWMGRDAHIFLAPGLELGKLSGNLGDLGNNKHDGVQTRGNGAVGQCHY